MKNNLLRFVLFFSFLFFSFLCSSQFLKAQCIIHGVDGGDPSSCGSNVCPPGNIVGQTFVACESGIITSITITAASNMPTGTQNFRIGASTSPPTATLGGPVYQTFTSSGGNETITIMLTPPFPVVSGNVYAFEIEAGSLGQNNAVNSSSDYTDGEYYFDAGSGIALAPGFDNDFGVQISPASSGAASIPTLSEWGLIILALLLMTFGTLYLVQPSVREGLNRNS